MQKKFLFARFVQILSWGFLPAAFLWFGLAKNYSFPLFTIVAGMVVILFTFGFGLMAANFIRCSNCGVSYYYDKRKSGSFVAVDMLKPVSKNCEKCGKLRSFETDGSLFTF